MGSYALLSGRVGLKANLLCRLGLCLSFEEPGQPDEMLYQGDDGDGREFNRYTLLGEYDLFFMALLRERMLLDGLDPNDEPVLINQFKAHLCRGVIMLSSRLKGLEDLADLVASAMERCTKHLVSGECSEGRAICLPGHSPSKRDG
jgi:DNA sulfur modification protein DndE